VRVAIAVFAAALVAVPAADAYRNPTPGKALVLQIPGMHRAQVQRNIVYERNPRLRMDVYRPHRARGRLPAVLLGGGKTSGQKIGWAQLIAASGMAAVAFDLRPGEPGSHDVRSAIAYARSHAKRLGIDPTRLCTLGFSAQSVPANLAATTRDAAPWLRCNVVYYGPLDRATLEPLGGQIPPMLVVKAGRDANAGINDSIDRFQAAAVALHADVRVVTYQGAPHAFDVGARTRRAKEIVRETLRFLRARLARPLPLLETCVNRAERRSAFRFFAADDTPLIGVVLGSGPRAVALSHQSDGNLCQWIGYARQLAGAGLRVLAYDSGPRVDLDLAAALEALRRTGSPHVVAAGASMGATAALIGSSLLPAQPDAVVSLSAPASYGALRALPAVRRLHSPVFFAASSEDDPYHGDALAMYAASGSSERVLEILPGAAHGIRMLEDPAFRARVTAFIEAH
jgi:dienelactone hydrolase